MTTIYEKMKQVLRDSGHFTEEQIKQVFSDSYTGMMIRQDNEDDEYTEEDEQDGRIESIEKIINLYDSIKQTDDMDWDDRIFDFSCRFSNLSESDSLQGITLSEKLSLEDGFLKPRMVLNVIEDLRDELKLVRV